MKIDRQARYIKDIKNVFLSIPEISRCNLVKWGGKYDISCPSGLYPTGFKDLRGLSIQQWVDLAFKSLNYKPY